MIDTLDVSRICVLWDLVSAFAGVLSVWLLKRHQRAYHWTGMAICTTGVVIVGLSSVFQGGSGETNQGNGALGMILILFGTLSSAVSDTIVLMFNEYISTIFMILCMSCLADSNRGRGEGVWVILL